MGWMRFVSSSAEGRSFVPNISAMLGPYMSQSHSPTRAPCASNATREIRGHGRFAHAPFAAGDGDDVAHAVNLLHRRRASGHAGGVLGGRRLDVDQHRAARDTRHARRAASASDLICCGTFGSFVVSAICTVTSPPLNRISLHHAEGNDIPAEPRVADGSQRFA